MAARFDLDRTLVDSAPEPSAAWSFRYFIYFFLFISENVKKAYNF